jgi:hypothetical protein
LLAQEFSNLGRFSVQDGTRRFGEPAPSK